MAKRASKSTSKHVAPDLESQELPEAGAVTPPEAAATGKGISGAEAVRQAMADGLEAPGDIRSFVKSQFGLDIPKPQISSYKSQEKARRAKKQSSAPKAGKKARMVQLEEVVEAIPPEVGGGIIADLAAIKGLVSKLGVAEVKKIAELFG